MKFITEPNEGDSMHGMIGYLLAHGWSVWPQFHWYYANHKLGGWIEWYASKPGTVLRCSIEHSVTYCNPTK